MVRVFGDCCNAGLERDGGWGLLTVWIRAAIDLFGNVPAERVQDLVRDRAARTLLIALAPLAIALGGLVYWADLHSAEAQYPMILLLILTALVGFAQPRLALLCALLIGACVPSAHALARMQGWRLPYPTDAWTPVFALVALVPALAGVWGGMWARRLLRYLPSQLQLPAIILGTGVLIVLSIYQGVRVVAREPSSSYSCSKYDPWYGLIRKVDHTFWVVPQGNSSSSTPWNQVGGTGNGVVPAVAPGVAAAPGGPVAPGLTVARGLAVAPAPSAPAVARPPWQPPPRRGKGPSIAD
jgi:hypothetical protein